jgi:two-component system response regulator QseB
MAAESDQVLTECLNVLSTLRASHPELTAILSPAEAHLRAVLRRTGSRRGIPYSLGGIVFDTTTRQALARGRRIDLTRREAALLEEFLRAPGHVITKARLEDRLYALDDSGSINALEAAVSRLRRKLATMEAALRIETKWGIGYRMVEVAPDEGRT